MDTSLTSAPPGAAPSGTGGSPLPSLKQHLRDQELAHIHRAIERSGGDKKKAAALLQISLATLYRKLDSSPHGL